MQTTTTDILIIGSGFAGIGMAIRLRQAGIDDFVILERADAVGGTWRDNHYPGAACDVESQLYSFSFEPKSDWSYVFARQPEIWRYMEDCATKHDLGRHLRFGAEVVRARYDETTKRWLVETRDGTTYRARVVVSGCGGLSRPAKPDIRGLESFQGTTFHSACWDDRCSLEGKRVAVIGTGASAIQIVPAIAPRVARLAVYQRTPPWIIARHDRAISGIEQKVFRRWPSAQRLVREGIFWKRELFGLGFIADTRIMKLGQRLALANLERGVRDPELRKKLTPSYVMGCKRVLLSNDYYPTFERDNVELVTDPIDEVRAGGIATKDRKERPFDAIILATGFEAAEQLAPFDIVGPGGARLDDLWRDGSEAYRGTTVAGFPNLFLIVGPNTGLGHGSMVHMIEAQITYILGALELMRDQGVWSVDVRAAKQREYNEWIHAKLAKTVWATGGCVSWYRTKNGKNTTLWPGFMYQFKQLMSAFDGDAYELGAPPRSVASSAMDGAARTAE